MVTLEGFTPAVHPVAELFPLLPREELEALAEDIRTNGLREPIWLDRSGRILDGRNRAAACKLAGVTCKALIYEKPEETIPAFISSANLYRRHLTSGQRAVIAEQMANLIRGAGRRSDGSKVQTSTISAEMAVAEAAHLVGASRRQTLYARKLRLENPEAYREVAAGRKTINRVLADMGRPIKGRRREKVEATQAAPANTAPASKAPAAKQRCAKPSPASPIPEPRLHDIQLGRELQEFLCRVPSGRTPEECAVFQDPQSSESVNRYFEQHAAWLRRWLDLWEERRAQAGDGTDLARSVTTRAPHLN